MIASFSLLARCKNAVSGSVLLLLLLVGSWVSGCSSTAPLAHTDRKFSFQHDTMAYANQVVWVYEVDPKTGKQVSHRRKADQDYVLHCFVVSRSARQFFQFARFAPQEPKAGEDTYRKLIRQVVAQNPRHSAVEEKKIIIPGYANLREFSAEHTALLKRECGGAWQSYFQRGNWRMVMPVTRSGQAEVAETLLGKIRGNEAPVVHIFCFPELTINHAILLFDARETETEIRFSAYDPNSPDHPVDLIYDRAKRTFAFPATFYFKGGAVDVYEIYRGLLF